MRLKHALKAVRGELRHEPTAKRVRATLGEHVVADSTRAMLVWEPRRVLPSYAVPTEDLDAELVPRGDGGPPAAEAPPDILHGSIPFDVHTTEGVTCDVRTAGGTLPAAAFRPDDPVLAGVAVLDFSMFDAWWEEEERIFAHPRDPFHRVDIRRSSRHVRIELDGEVLADSTRPTLVFETSLPTRFYLPREDVRVDLQPSDKRTACAYKGEARYWSPHVRGTLHPDLAWGYERPLADAPGVAGLVCFLNERVDVVVDGERQERSDDPVAASILEEAGI